MADIHQTLNLIPKAGQLGYNPEILSNSPFHCNHPQQTALTALLVLSLTVYKGFPDSSVGKESACSAGDPGSVARLGKFAGEWKGYPLQYSWASLVAQMVKNLPAMRETSVQSLGWEDHLEEGMETHSNIFA